MKNKLVYCLFFFCLLGCTGCMKGESDKNQYENKQTIGKAAQKQEEQDEIVVLIYGDTFMTGVARTICDSIGARFFDLAKEQPETMEEPVQKAEYVLIGTTKAVPELELALRNRLEEEQLAEKKTALFLINREEETEEYEEKLLEWYPKAELLPTFTMESTENLQNELGRINGWLTTLMTYGKIPD